MEKRTLSVEAPGKKKSWKLTLLGLLQKSARFKPVGSSPLLKTPGLPLNMERE
jgi:hypothetical protein